MSAVNCGSTVLANTDPSIFILGTRDTAVPLRQQVERALDQSDLTACIDFCGISVALELAESGTPDDVAELPEWLRKELFDWADEFEKPPQSWQIVWNTGSRDVTEEGKKLLALLRQIQPGTR